jgi:hypothetical protein
MRTGMRWSVATVSLLALLALGMPPSYADHGTQRGPGDVKNIQNVADIENSTPFAINSDMAFWGDLAFQGNFQGFQIHDISDPANPVNLVDFEGCPGGQGDVIIWEDLLVRTWDAPAGDGVECGGAPVPAGFEGLHFFDVSDPTNPTLIGDLPIVGGILSVGPDDFFGAAAQFGPPLDATGVTGELELVNDGVVGTGDPPGTETDGCEPLVGFTAGNIALVDRGFCGFSVKVKNAQDAGAVGVIVLNNVAGGAGNMTGLDPTITIPSIHVSLETGNTLKALPAETEATLAADPDSGIPGCGSHTATGVPDPANGLLRIYNGGSNAICGGMDLVQVPLTAPATAEWYGRAEAIPAAAELGRSCHDITVYMVDKMRAVCSGSWVDADPDPDESFHGFAYFSMDAADGGSLAEPALMYQQDVPGTFTIGHTSSFSWDGKTLIWTHEPGGGTGAQCEITDPIEFRTMYFFRAETGNELGRWIIPSQSSEENCASVHIMQSIPTTNGLDVLTSGTYQAGTYLVDYTNPINFGAKTIGYSDPPPRVPTTLLAGAWATYWYNGFLYESDILFGLHIMRSTSPEAQTDVELDFLNPQTMMPFDLPVTAFCRGQEADFVGTSGADVIVGTPGDDVIAGLGGRDDISGRGGNDVVCAGGGGDTVRGRGGNDVLLGQNGRDTLVGGAGRDVCNGGPGRDSARGCETERSIP